MNPEDQFEIPEYTDAQHAEVLEDLREGEYGYKYRLIDGVVMPPYITPARYALSRAIDMRPGDICYTSYPKSGSTWLSYVIVLLAHQGEMPDRGTLRNCLHWVASSYTYPRSRDELDSSPPPRIFKSHMPYEMAVGGCPEENPCRYVYVARNPKDVAVSYYHFESDKSWAGNYSGPWEHWLKIFMEGMVQRGDWFDHVLGWWRHRAAENIHFIKYEGLRRDFEGEVRRLAGFLGYPLTDELLCAIGEKTSFENMKSQSFSNMSEIKELGGFFRKGQAGSWREQFTSAQSDAFDELYAGRMAGSGLDFEFE